MTIMEALNRIDELKPNSYSTSEKIRWLSTLDGLVKTRVIDTHEGGESVQFNGYTEDIDLDTVLLVEDLYADVYIKWLETQIDYANGEYAKYNNTAMAFNSAFTEYTNYYNRTHMPKGTKTKYF